jgi:hypothetical protein
VSTSLVDVVDEGGGIHSPLTIICKMASTQDELRYNVTTNLKRNLPRLLDLPGILHARNQPLAIVGGGPSLDEFSDKIKKFEHVMVCGSAHDHVVSLGIKPTFAIAVDGAQDAVNWFSNPQPNTSYLLASQCHPNMFDWLALNKVAMWHFKGQVDGEEEIFGRETLINWGVMVGNLSIQIALFLGFQELHFFGMDGNHQDGKHHAYDVGTYDEMSKNGMGVFEVNGKKFVSTTALISQMEHFFDTFASSDGQFLKGYVYGDGLWANVIKASPPEMKEWLEAV